MFFLDLQKSKREQELFLSIEKKMKGLEADKGRVGTSSEVIGDVRGMGDGGGLGGTGDKEVAI